MCARYYLEIKYWNLKHEIWKGDLFSIISKTQLQKQKFNVYILVFEKYLLCIAELLSISNVYYKKTVNVNT